MTNSKLTFLRRTGYVAIFSVVNMFIPYTAMADGINTVQEFLDSCQKSAPSGVQSRRLTPSEMKASKGRTAGYGNPYNSGNYKFDASYQGVNLRTGNFSTSATDLSFEGGYGIPVAVTRTYSANNIDEGPFGVGWTLSADIRTTAGALLKSPDAPDYATPYSIEDRNATEPDPNAITEPIDGVIITNADGRQYVVSRDVDGIIQPPLADHNTYSPVYKETSEGSGVFELDYVDVTTPEETVYHYVRVGHYSNGSRPWNNPSGTADDANILKPTTVTDRHGNVTTYTYSGSSDTVSFEAANGTVNEQKLTQVSMPGGHVIHFTWGGSGKPSNRITAVSDTDTDHKILYEYNEGGQLTSVTSRAGYETSYSYAAAHQSGGSALGSFLHTITDPQGRTTTVYYVTPSQDSEDSNFRYSPNFQTVITYRIDHPNGTRTLFEAYAEVPSGESLLDQDVSEDTIVPSWSTGGANQSALRRPFYDVRSDATSTSNPLNMGEFGWEFVTGTQPLIRTGIGMPNGFSSRGDSWDYDAETLNCQSEYHSNIGSAAHQTGDNYTVTRAEHSHNFLGNPISEKSWQNSQSGTGLQCYSNGQFTQETQYAYWGRDKYFQQKAVRTKVHDAHDSSINWKYSYTDYYDRSNSSAGKRGMPYRVYEDKYNNFTIGSTDSAWRTNIALPGTPVHSASFDYDSHGRTVAVYKVKSVSGTTGTYVLTATGYDDNYGWGNAYVVTEDENGSNERETQTLAFDSTGRATETRDAANHEFTTTYDLDGRIVGIDRTDTGNVHSVIAYSYGEPESGASAGQVIGVQSDPDEYSEEISYAESGPELGSVISINEIRYPYVSQSLTYTYDSIGERETSLYSTPNGDTKWKYTGYATTRLGLSPSRAFTMLIKQAYSGGSWSDTDERMNYVYDDLGRLKIAEFGTTLRSDKAWSDHAYANTALGAVAGSTCQAQYTYDGAGHLSDLTYKWLKYTQNQNGSWPTSPTETAIYRNDSTYDSVQGMKLTSINREGSNQTTTRSESYKYDADRGYLDAASTNGGSSYRTWEYDAAGNRTSDSGNTGTWTYDSLNRMTASPGHTYSHDVLGNRTWRDNGLTTAQKYRWDELNRMTATYNHTTGAQYMYRPDGMRVVKLSNITLDWTAVTDDGYASGYYDTITTTNVPTTRYYYDGQMLMEDDWTRPVSSVTTKDVTKYGLGARGIDVIIATTGITSSNEGTTSTAFPLYDAHGNMVNTLSRASGGSFALGSSTYRYYDAWGGLDTGPGTGNEPRQRYCANLGHLQDDESGLIYMRARYYEPGTGRFVSEDPELDGVNWYDYCSNNSVNRNDSTGGFDGWVAMGLAGGVLAAMMSFNSFIFSAMPLTTPVYRMAIVRAFAYAEVAILFFTFALGASINDNPSINKNTENLLTAGEVMTSVLVSSYLNGMVNSTRSSMLLTNMCDVGKKMMGLMFGYCLLLLTAIVMIEKNR